MAIWEERESDNFMLVPLSRDGIGSADSAVSLV